MDTHEESQRCFPLVAEGYGDSGTPPHDGVGTLHRRIHRRTYFLMDQSYLDLLSGQGGSQAWVSLDEFNLLGDEGTPDNATQEDISAGPKRKLNFSDEEDKALCNAWLSVGMDCVTGNQQRGNTYWARIHEEFCNYLGRRPERTEGSLSHRWSTVSALCHKWGACCEAIQRKNASGTCIDDKNAAAHEMFKGIHKKSFTLMHCWVLLRHHPKWNSTLTSKKAKKSSGDSPGSSARQTFSSINLEDDMPQDSNEINRPIGTKAAKAQRKRGAEDPCSSFEKALESTQSGRLISEQKKDERFEKLLSMEQSRIELERSREERSIMDVDLEKLSGARLAYYKRLQEEIIRRTITDE